MRLLWFNLQVNKNRQGLAFALDWINAMAERVECIDVITMNAGEYQVRDNVRVYSVGKEKGYSEPRRAIEFYKILWRLLRQQPYDGCFAHMMPLFALMAGPFLRVKGIPLVLWYTHKSVTPVLRLATVFANRVVTASRESFRIDSSKVRIIGHGIDPNKFVPGGKQEKEKQPFTIMTVGRLSRIKRIDLILEAIALFRWKMPETALSFKIIGGPLTPLDVQYIDELKQQVIDLQLQDVVEFTGSISFDEIVTHYQQADCFVSMSDTGSIDKVVLEAMSCEMPVITRETYTEVFGADLANELIVAQDAEQLSERLLYVANLTPDERHRLTKELRTLVVRDHSLAGCCARIIEQFQEVQAIAS